jgi:hypothetical protein
MRLVVVAVACGVRDDTTTQIAPIASYSSFAHLTGHPWRPAEKNHSVDTVGRLVEFFSKTISVCDPRVPVPESQENQRRHSRHRLTDCRRETPHDSSAGASAPLCSKTGMSTLQKDLASLPSVRSSVWAQRVFEATDRACLDTPGNCSWLNSLRLARGVCDNCSPDSTIARW